MDLYLIRHTPVAVGKGVCYGCTDVVLADTHPHDWRQLRSRLPSSFDRVYSSPLSRCLSLAKTLASHPPLVDDRLREMNFGEWENRRWSDIGHEPIDRWTMDLTGFTPPRGEAIEMVSFRALAFLRDVLAGNVCDSMAVVSHGGPIRCLLAGIEGIPLKEILSIPIDWGHYYHLRYDERTWSVIGRNL